MSETERTGPPPWLIRSRQVSPHRVEATVDGLPVRVECPDAPLVDVPEAWGSAFALPASRAGADLDLAVPVDAAWADGARRNVALAAGWWGGRADLVVHAPRSGRVAAVRRRARPPVPAGGRALCFTGGVDSFFSLLGDAHQPTCLLYVVGFDVPVGDQSRIDHVVGLVRSVAAERGLPALIVTTDLRDHPRFAAVSWEHTHGAALAAIGHLLSATVSTLVVPPSYGADRLVPWGSRPDLDTGWSVPGRLVVEHGDASGHRLDRVGAIARDPLVWRHLRVCWQNVGSDLNCGRCEKCVRTMAMLAASDVLDECETFPSRRHLPAAIDAMEPIPAGTIPMWTDLLTISLRPPERDAVDRLLARSSG
ncbi:hypothetical protein [Aquihabitans sp. McL0605]|uniref:hypothetical protein n=1 Tax=Aquihabitans sp. McL0605 TaxID=3415671 RepID=UPI003CF1A827